MARARNKTTEDTANDAATEAAEMAALEAALNGDGDEEMTIDDADFADVDDDALNEALAADEAKEKAYSEQKSDIDVGDDAEIAAETEKANKKVNRGAGQQTIRDADAFAKEICSILGENPVFDSNEGELTEAQVIDAMREVTQIKVREKVIGLCQFIMNGKSPSVYTKIAAEELVKAYLDGGKMITVADFKKAYEKKGYKKGTVDAQAGQMMVLFRVMGLATSEGRGILKPNPNSVFLDVLASS